MIVRKHSKKRDAILECVRSTKEHPTADWVYSQLKPSIPDLSLGTVYRNLASFKREGVISSVGAIWKPSTLQYKNTRLIHKTNLIL